MTSCEKIENEIVPKGRYYDPCFTNTFLNEHSNVNGWISTAITDAEETLKNYNKNREKYSKYTKFIQNKVRTIGPPELALYPLKERVNTNIIIDAEKVNDFMNSNEYNYQLIHTFDREYTSIYKWMDEHAIVNENSFYFTYKL
jgi:hypothetical protein